MNREKVWLVAQDKLSWVLYSKYSVYWPHSVIIFFFTNAVIAIYTVIAIGFTIIAKNESNDSVWPFDFPNGQNWTRFGEPQRNTKQNTFSFPKFIFS